MSGKTVSKVIGLYVSDPKGVQAYADEVKQYVKNTAINRAEGSEILIFS